MHGEYLEMEEPIFRIEITQVEKLIDPALPLTELSSFIPAPVIETYIFMQAHDGTPYALVQKI